VPDVDGPTHRYLGASPGCWALYGELLAAELLDRERAQMQRLTINAYAVQHPGRAGPQTSQSVWIHLVGLCLVLERGLPADRTTGLMARLAGQRRSYRWLKPPESRGATTILDVRAAVGLDAYDSAVAAWSVSAWLAWQRHHDAVRALVDELLAA
jgi:hypothetical protein